MFRFGGQAHSHYAEHLVFDGEVREVCEIFAMQQSWRDRWRQLDNLAAAGGIVEQRDRSLIDAEVADARSRLGAFALAALARHEGSVLAGSNARCWDLLRRHHPGVQGSRGLHVCDGDHLGPGCGRVFRGRSAPTRCPACRLNAAPILLHPGPGDLQSDGRTPRWADPWDPDPRSVVVARVCAGCGEPFTTGDRRRRTCSDACRQRARRRGNA